MTHTFVTLSKHILKAQSIIQIIFFLNFILAYHKLLPSWIFTFWVEIALQDKFQIIILKVVTSGPFEIYIQHLLMEK